MNIPENDYQILRLTDEFYRTYPSPPYTEILRKPERPYNCLLFQTHYGYFVCVPYRTEISHGYAYRFRGSQRSIEHKSGLDYTKMVIIKNMDFIGNTDAVIDRDEFRETMARLQTIKRNALQFLEDYISHMNGSTLLRSEEFRRRYRFSPLKYFHEELGITAGPAHGQKRSNNGLL